MKHSTGFLLLCLFFGLLFGFWGGGFRQGVMFRAKENTYLIERDARMNMVIALGRDRDKKAQELIALKRDFKCPE